MEWLSGVIGGLLLLVVGAVIGHQFRRLELLRQDRLMRYAKYLEQVTDFQWQALRSAERPPKYSDQDLYAFFARVSAAEADLLLVASPAVLKAVRVVNEVLTGDEYMDAVDLLPHQDHHSAALKTMRRLLSPALEQVINAMRKDVGTPRADAAGMVLRREE